MSAEENKAIVRRVVDGVNIGDFDLLDELMVPNYVRHCQATPQFQVRSREDMNHFLRQDRTTIPNPQMTIEMMVAEGDWVAF